MTTQLAQKKEIDQVKGLVIAENPLGPIVFLNSDLITQKTRGIMMKCIDDGGFEDFGHGILGVNFRVDGHPWAEEDDSLEIWRWFPDPKVMVCNIIHCVDCAIKDTQSMEVEFLKYTSVRAATWLNIIKGFCHEAHHAGSFADPDDGNTLWVSTDAREEEEDKAVEFANKMAFHLAKTTDIEIEFSQVVDTLVNKSIVDAIEAIIEDEKAPEYLIDWANVQSYMLENDVVFYKPSETGKDKRTIEYKTLKQFMHFCSGDSESDTEWASPTIGVACSIVQAPFNENSSGQPGYTFQEEDDTWEDEENQAPYVYNNVPGMQGVATFMPQMPQVPQQVAMYATIPQGYPQTQQPTLIPPVYQQAQQTAPKPVYIPVNQNPAVVKGEGAYAPIMLPAGVDAQAVINGLYLKISLAIFQNCGFNSRDMVKPFGTADSIKVPLALNQYESLFVKEMDHDNAANQLCRGVKVDGAIIGKYIDIAKTLPGYDLILSTIDGTQIKRRFFPQNPWKKNDKGVYSKTAQEAQAGHCIMWIMDPDSKVFSIRVYNGVIEYNEKGAWVK